MTLMVECRKGDIEESRMDLAGGSARHSIRGGSGKQTEPLTILPDLVTNGHMRMKMVQEMKMQSEEDTDAGQFGGYSKTPSLGF